MELNDLFAASTALNFAVTEDLLFQPIAIFKNYFVIKFKHFIAHKKSF